MDSLSHLETLAEVAIAIAGFSALIAIIGRGATSTKLEGFRIQIMLEASLFVVALALLPVVLFGLGLSHAAVWRTSAALFLLTDALITVTVWVRGRDLARYYDRGDRVAGVAISAFSYAADAVVVLVLLGLDFDNPSGLYLLALYLNLLLSGVLFIRFASVNFMPGEDAGS